MKIMKVLINILDDNDDDLDIKTDFILTQHPVINTEINEKITKTIPNSKVAKFCDVINKEIVIEFDKPLSKYILY